MLDHATGIVVGETAVIEDDVSILQSVTLGGTGKTSGDRHPKIREGVMIGAGAKILGNIEVGRGAKSAQAQWCCSRCRRTTAAGVPARIVGKPESDKPAMDMDQHFNGIHHTFEYGDGFNVLPGGAALTGPTISSRQPVARIRLLALQSGNRSG